MSNKKTSAGFPIFGVLGLIFITLKLAGIGAVAKWSWWWVLAPFWGSLAVALTLVIVAFIAALIAETRSKR